MKKFLRILATAFVVSSVVTTLGFCLTFFVFPDDFFLSETKRLLAGFYMFMGGMVVMGLLFSLLMGKFDRLTTTNQVTTRLASTVIKGFQAKLLEIKGSNSIPDLMSAYTAAQARFGDYVMEEFSNEVLMMVPEWHLFIGSQPGRGVTMLPEDSEARKNVVGEIQIFIEDFRQIHEF